MNITAKDLITLGFPQNKALGQALEVIYSMPDADETVVKASLEGLLKDPSAFVEHAQWGAVAKTLLIPAKGADIQALKEDIPNYAVYGAEAIEAGALKQMETAMRLPVTRAGALMPDAHQGYGLPIGGVLATENAVIPYGVGVDIGCRMCMSIFELPDTEVVENRKNLKRMLVDNTRFGIDTFKQPIDHDVLGSPLFREIRVVRELQDKAWKQIGSSGGGNHFVEFGVTEISDPHNEFGLKPGKYLALLSHSGSRGFGATIANHYTKLAMELCKLPQEAKHLAWLDLNTEAGQEYWLAMNLAGDYASACHHQIHDRMVASLGFNAITRVENHHNFAWKEKDSKGKEWIVHRKGATPAGKGVLGIIPGSMTAPGFIVRGKGEEASINSASHGAGRRMSRTQAKNTLNRKEVAASLAQAGVDLIGSGLDEAPQAYKDINRVMAAQSELVDVVGSFLPKIVRMCGDERFKEAD